MRSCGYTFFTECHNKTVGKAVYVKTVTELSLCECIIFIFFASRVETGSMPL